MALAVDQHRVHRAAAIVNRGIADNIDKAGLGIDLDLADCTGIGIGGDAHRFVGDPRQRSAQIARNPFAEAYLGRKRTVFTSRASVYLRYDLAPAPAIPNRYPSGQAARQSARDDHVSRAALPAKGLLPLGPQGCYRHIWWLPSTDSAAMDCAAGISRISSGRGLILIEHCE
jgi:hypothetical protein